MSFKINLSIYKSDYPDSKTPYYGGLSLKADELRAFVTWLGKQKPNENGYIELKAKGWKRETRNGKPYISVLAEPPAEPAADAAQSLAAATDGTVSEITESDLF